LERFAQTINITTPTANASTRSPERARPLTWSLSAVASGTSLLTFGFSASMRGVISLRSATALASVTPGFSLAMTAMVLPQRSVSGDNGNGV